MTDSKEKYIPMSGTLKFTSDYSIFIKAKGNRKVYPTQVAKLLLKIKAIIAAINKIKPLAASNLKNHLNGALIY